VPSQSPLSAALAAPDFAAEPEAEEPPPEHAVEKVNTSEMLRRAAIAFLNFILYVSYTF
jgi:hypothetical protein